MIPREIIDEAKQLASKATGIPPERILISATHTHTAPTRRRRLPERAGRGLRRSTSPSRSPRASSKADDNLAPAKIGWGVGKDADAGLQPPLADEAGHASPPTRSAGRPTRCR